MARGFSKTDKSAPFRVEMTGYFRGLDGFSSYYRKQYVSAQSGSSDNGKGESAEAGSRNKPVGLNHGEVLSQFDYIGRICNLIDRNGPPHARSRCLVPIFLIS